MRHIKDLKHCIEVKMFHVQTLKNNLSNDEIDVLLLKLNFLEEIQEKLLSYCALPVSLGREGSHNLLIISSDEFGNLYEHFLFFLLGHYFIFGH